jgi:glutamate 5-kinase
LQKIIEGENVGTLFYPVAERLTKRKHWLAWTQKSCGEVVIDDGAVNAITKRGKSLLPTGVMEVRGEFERGDAVTVVSKSGTEIALGLTEYSSSELRKIKGCHSNEIECVLGYRHEDEVIHRDNMVLTEEINRCYTEGASK